MSARFSSGWSRFAGVGPALLLLVIAGCAGPRSQMKADPLRAEAKPATEENAHPQAAAEQPEPITIEVDPAVLKSSSAVAWIVYGGVVAPRRKLALAEQRPIDWFGDEVAGRSAAAKAWRDAKVKPGEDPYLDALVKVEAAGFMPEYVARHVATPGFAIDGKGAAALRLDAFAKWAPSNLGADHRAEMHAAVLIEGKAFPPALGEGASKAVPLGDVSECAMLAGRQAAAATEWRTKVEASPEVVLTARDRGEWADLLRDPALRPRIATKGARWGSPDINDVFLVAGFCAIENGRPEEAEGHFRAALSINPLHVKIATELAHVYVMQKRWDEALRLTDDLMARTADDGCVQALLWRKKGFILFELLRLREARAAYLRSLTFEPGNDMALAEIKLIDQRRSEWEPARSEKSSGQSGPPGQSAKAGRAPSAKAQIEATAGEEMPGAVPPSLTVRTKCQEKR